MKTASYRKGERMIGVAGSLLTLYLVLLIGLAYASQTRLRESLLAQQQRNLEQRAGAIAYLLSGQQGVLQGLAEHRQVQAFLAEYARETSTEDTTPTGPAEIAVDIADLLNRALSGLVPATIACVANDGRSLIEAGDDPAGWQPHRVHRVNMPLEPGVVQLRRGSAGTLIGLSAAVMYMGRGVGFVSAEIETAHLLGPLGFNDAEPIPGRGVAILGPDAETISGDDRAGGRPDGSAVDENFLLAPVPNTGLSLVAHADMAMLNGALTSPLLLVALALISLPLAGGVVYLLRLSVHIRTLQARSSKSSEQRTLLRRQIKRLQHEIDQRLTSEQQLSHQANFDQLTGLPNRGLAMDRLAQAIKWAKREARGVLVVFLDLDRFKQVNDSIGHAAGDELLCEAAQRLLTRVRESDTVSRLGGDEFLVICTDEQAQPDWERLAGQLLKVLSQPFYISGHEVFVGASIGVATYPDGGAEPETLLKNADIAMYAAKERGRNRYSYFDPSMDASSAETLRLEHRLRHALKNREFRLVFQPIVDLSSGATVAVEALLRWTSDDLGSVAPERFIPIAEETGLIHEIGEWVLVEACNTLSTMQPRADFRVAVNLSSKQFGRPSRLLDSTLRALQTSGLMPNQLELEITESVLMDDRPEITSLIHQLDRIGVRLSIDDFGTGYSALNYLQRFPFDVVKIDRTFTHQIPGSESNASLIRAIIAIAQALDLEVIAEGIENRQQAGFLLVQRCRFGQGRLYSEPMTAAQLEIHLNEARALSA